MKEKEEVSLLLRKVRRSSGLYFYFFVLLLVSRVRITCTMRLKPRRCEIRW